MSFFINDVMAENKSHKINTEREVLIMITQIQKTTKDAMAEFQV